MKVAALDLGTNSFLCLVAEVHGGRVVQVIEDQVEVVRLGQDVHRTGLFQPEALIRSKDCLERFAKTIDKHKPERILAMATSAARDASNSEELFRIGEELGIPIEVIPGGQEAAITFRGATADISKDGKIRLVIDVGGGSTEYIVGQDHRVIFGQSLNIGCVRLTEAMIDQQPTPADQIHKLKNFIKKEFSQIQSQLMQFKIDEVIAVAGTPSAIAAMELGGFDSKKVDGYKLTKKNLEDWEIKLAELSVSEKVSQLGLERGRADVILVGNIILSESLELLGLDELQVSTKGVRFGVAIELASRSPK
jgi:exopolyphosphatase/guanosine-5'-triphosphate,3'-diphosphate pyrophosphatase